ncbi:tripartite tricarboxylate transporter TctB family protein [Paracoccus pacificus]|uniref:Tripartite tricarboxylate transporter TctB family protein n=1 Tax=Paracoccus pacificus TaxID=1463598 RepID=A0ABW4R4F2_9RHOB
MAVTRFHAELATSVGTAALGLLAVFGAMELGYGWTPSGPQSGYFPFYVGLILIAASLWNIGAAFLKHRASRAASDTADDFEEPFLDRERLGRLSRFLVTMLIFVIATLFLGIYVGSAGYIAWSAWRQGGYRPYLALALGVGFSVALYVIFEVIFLMPLLKGPIEPLLGIY